MIRLDRPLDRQWIARQRKPRNRAKLLGRVLRGGYRAKPEENENPDRQNSQNVRCSPNCMFLMGEPISWIMPAAPLSIAVTGSARFVWLRALKTSHRNSTRYFSTIRKLLSRERSISKSPGPRSELFPAVPNR